MASLNFRSFGASLPLVSRPTLGVNPPTVIDKTDGRIPRTIGEPSLSAALGPLSADEAADYKSWGPKEKINFIAGYQYLATGTAAALRRVDGTSFDGYLTQGISITLGALQAAQDYFGKMSPELAATADQAASLLKDASTKTEPRGIEFAKKYQLLRDRAAWELATQNDLTIEYEILGTDPANPGLVYTRKIGEDKAPDYSAVFSTQTPREFYESGLALEDKFEALGVTFKRLNTLGANPRIGAGPALILAILITLVVALLAFFWLSNHANQQEKLLSTAVDFVSKDPRLTDAEKAERILAIRRSEAFFGEIFSSPVPWVGILIALGVGALAVFAYPYIKKAVDRMPTPSLGWSEWS